MTVQNVKIRSLRNSELTESTVKCFNSIRPPTKTFSDVRVASSPTFRKKKGKIHFIYLFIHSMHLYWLFPGTELGTTVTGLRRLFFK